MNLPPKPGLSAPVRATQLLHTAIDCLAVLELAVNWEAEKLYGVEAWDRSTSF